MATTLYFRGTAPDWSRGQGDADLVGTTRNWTPKVLSTTRGAAATSATRNTVTGATNGLEVGGAADGSLPWEWITDPFDQDITLAATATVNIWALESSMNANVGVGFIIQRLDSTGAIASTVYNYGAGSTEVGTTATLVGTSAVLTSTDMLKGDRLRVRVYIDDAATTTMATGFTGSFRYDGPTAAADGDSYISFTENFGFLTTAPTGSTLYLTNTASAVDPNGASYDAKEAWTSRGAGVVLAISTGSVTGPTAPILAKNSGSTFIEWFTKQLTAFTLDGLVACNLRAFEGDVGANAAIRCEIAVCASDGTSPVVWGASNDGVELGTSEAAMTFNVAGEATAVTDGQCIRIRVFFDDAPGLAQGTGLSLGLWFAGTSAAASGDTYITLPQTVTEFSSGPVANALQTVGGKGMVQAIYPTATG